MAPSKPLLSPSRASLAPNDLCVVEELTYPGIIGLVKALRGRLHTTPIDSSLPDRSMIELLDRAVQRREHPRPSRPYRDVAWAVFTDIRPRAMRSRSSCSYLHVLAEVVATLVTRRFIDDVEHVVELTMSIAPQLGISFALHIEEFAQLLTDLPSEPLLERGVRWIHDASRCGVAYEWDGFRLDVESRSIPFAPPMPQAFRCDLDDTPDCESR